MSHSVTETSLQDESIVASEDAIESDGIDGPEIRMVGAVGSDEYGDLFREALRKNGIDSYGLIQISKQLSQVSFVMVERHTGVSRCLPTRELLELVGDPNSLQRWKTWQMVLGQTLS